MPREIERKFLVAGESWREGATATSLLQGYLSIDSERTVRVRIEGDEARLTIKGVSRGASRLEFEYPISLEDGREMLNELAIEPVIEKTRYRVEHGGLTWEIDEFHGLNEGLRIAEVELASEDQTFEKPDWVGDEVTGDPRYFNANLVARPFSRWGPPVSR